MRRSKLVNTKDFYKEYNKREGQIKKENYGLVTRFQQERKEELQREKEKDLILIDKIDNIISDFEDRMERMTRINESIMHTIAEESREIRRMREQQ